MKQKFELKILVNFAGFDPESQFIQKCSILTLKHAEEIYELTFMEVDSSIDYKITLKQAINCLLDRNAIICGRDLCDSSLEELIATGECEIEV